jgi:hypothetical protein
MYSFHNGQTSVILRVKLLDSTVSTGAGKTGLLFSSAGLIISTIADNEPTATAYTQAGSTIETVTVLGTYAAPTATKCRFKEVDSTNHPGIYEIQIADARYAVANAKSLIVSISGAANLAQQDIHIPLTAIDPYSVASFFKAQMTETYAATGAAPTPEQALNFIQQTISNFAFSGTTKTVKKLDGSTTAAVMTLDSSTTPTSSNRTS